MAVPRSVRRHLRHLPFNEFQMPPYRWKAFQLSAVNSFVSVAPYYPRSFGTTWR